MLKRDNFICKNESDLLNVNIGEIQSYLLELFFSFQKFCADNKIKFSLTFGSLLGAIREREIIKWDDDIDIMIDADNYDALKCNLHKLKDYGLNYYHYSITKHTYMNEIRIFKGGYYRTLRENSKKYLTPISIDIFTVNKVSTDANGIINKKTKCIIKRILRNKKFLTLKELRYNSKNHIRYIVRVLVKLLLLVIPEKELHKKIDKDISKLYNPKMPSYRLFIPSAGTSFANLYDSDFMNEYKETVFSYGRALCVSKYDYFLTMVYGDWKTPIDYSSGLKEKEHYIYIANDNYI